MPARFNCSTTTGPTEVKSKKLMISSATGCPDSSCHMPLPSLVQPFGRQQFVALGRVVLQVWVLLDHRGRLARRQQPFDAVRSRLSAAQAVRRGRPAADRRVPLSGVQPGEGRRAADREGLDQRRQRDVAGRDGRAGRARDHQLLRLHRRRSGRRRAVEAGRHRGDLLRADRTSSTASAQASTPAASSATAAATAPTSTTRCGSTRPRPPRSPAATSSTSRCWHNEEYDKLVDELYGISPTETEKVMEIWKKASRIWLPELPGHPDLAGPPPPADEHDLLDRLADGGEPVRQPGPLPSDLAAA